MKDDALTGKKQIATAIGELVKASRESKGWSKYRLAKESGITPVHIKGIEDGRLSVRVDTLNKLCIALEADWHLPID